MLQYLASLILLIAFFCKIKNERSVYVASKIPRHMALVVSTSTMSSCIPEKQDPELPIGSANSSSCNNNPQLCCNNKDKNNDNNSYLRKKATSSTLDDMANTNHNSNVDGGKSALEPILHCAPIGSVCHTDDGRLQVCYPDSPCQIPIDAPQSGLLDLVRKLLGKTMGTCVLIIIVVGWYIQAEALSNDVGAQLWINAFVTGAGLFGLITILGPVSGTHFNPCVSLVDVLNPRYATIQSTVVCRGANCGGVVSALFWLMACLK